MRNRIDSASGATPDSDHKYRGVVGLHARLRKVDFGTSNAD